MEMFFKIRNWEVYTASNGPDGIRLVEQVQPFLVVLDLRLPGMNGLEVLEKLRGTFPGLQVVVITAFQNMESTIQAIKLGAFDYLHKPIDIAEMDAVIRRLEAAASLDAQHDYEFASLDQAFDSSDHRPQIIARSRKMKEVFKNIALVSESRVTVLIQGESGTGKELIARSIHLNSPWSHKPFTVMDCSTLVDTLVESELFGYEKGAFTGANETRKGRLEMTGEGTIFFDEIGELPLQMQSKLLRFLQSGEFVKVGGNRPIYSNARIVAATNRNLTKLVQERKFREDLYYRLKVVTIDAPPLRSRRSDIPVLARFLLEKTARRNVAKCKRLSPEALEVLMDYDWPGNVRQLENLIIRCAVLTSSVVITREHVDACMGDSPNFATTQRIAASLEDVEREHILSALDSNEWHLGKTCDQLGMSRPTLRSRMKKYGLCQTDSRRSRTKLPQNEKRREKVIGKALQKPQPSGRSAAWEEKRSR